MLPQKILKNKKLMFLTITLVIVIGLLTWCAFVLSSDVIYKGITISGVDVSGLNKLEATKLLKEKLDITSKREGLRLTFNETAWILPYESISYKIEIDNAISNALLIGRNGNLFNRIVQIVNVVTNPVNINANVAFDMDYLRKILEGIKSEIDTTGKSAEVKFKVNEINYKKHVVGYSMELDTCFELVKKQLLNKKVSDLVLIVNVIKPKILYEDIKNIKSTVAAFNTRFNEGDQDRSHNIRYACSKINNTIIMPGETFSMNEALGPRTIENGYKEANVIYKNELIKGPGGGVCQVTTTLYCSVLKACMDVVERMHHSLPLGYVKPGQDATIAEGNIDFKFSNNLGYAVAIKAFTSGNVLHVYLMSKPKLLNNISVKLVSKIIEQYDPPKPEYIIDESIPEGQVKLFREAKKGVKSHLFREVYDANGKLIENKKISEDIYRSVRAQYKVNSTFMPTNGELAEVTTE